jgi:phytoene dehydrogenase-like protein
MKPRRPNCPRWAVKALQGLSYWIGYRHSLYADHPLPEAAMVVETCNLIYANLPDDDTLVCERLYRTLLPDGGWPTAYGRQARVDLLVLRDRPKRPTADERLHDASFVAIEVKRASAQHALIDRDLQRLTHLKATLPSNRAMLFVISEARRPERFVDSNGVRSKRKHPIPDTDAHFRVIRACKATSLFSGKDTAHYSCILEIFLNK